MGIQDNGRDAQGRFKKGVSGNPGGRPRKQVHPPGKLDFRLARELVRESEWTDASGARRKGTRFEAIVDRIMDEAMRAKPKEALAILERLDALGAIDLAQVLVFKDGREASQYMRQQEDFHRKFFRAVDEVEEGWRLSAESMEILGMTPPPDDRFPD